MYQGYLIFADPSDRCYVGRSESSKGLDSGTAKSGEQDPQSLHVILAATVIRLGVLFARFCGKDERCIPKGLIAAWR